MLLKSGPLKQMGHLMIDHSASPGIPADIARQLNLDPKMVGEGTKAEFDTATCSHCKGSVYLNPHRTRARNYCIHCSGHYICDGCAYLTTLPDYVHTPFDKVIDIHMDAAAW